MKKILCIALSACLAVQSRAQNAGDNYAFTSDIILQKFDPFTQTIIVDPANIFMAKRGAILRIRSKNIIGAAEGYSIEFWDFRKGGQTQPKVSLAESTVANHIIGASENGILFYISKSDLQQNATNNFRKPKGLAKIDAVVLPIKLRFHNRYPGGNFDFLQSISIGPALAWTRNHGGPFGTSSTAFTVGFNITNVSADEKTAPGAISSKTTLLGLTPFLGFNFEFRSINFGALAGLDILTGEAGKVWAYRKSPWVGISVGTSIFSTTEKKQ